MQQRFVILLKTERSDDGLAKEKQNDKDNYHLCLCAASVYEC